MLLVETPLDLQGQDAKCPDENEGDDPTLSS